MLVPPPPPRPQLSVMHFFGSKRKDKGFQYQHKRLSNPLCSEFGIHNKEQLAHFIEVELPDFRLVRSGEERGGWAGHPGSARSPDFLRILCRSGGSCCLLLPLLLRLLLPYLQCGCDCWWWCCC